MGGRGWSVGGGWEGVCMCMLIVQYRFSEGLKLSNVASSTILKQFSLSVCVTITVEEQRV